MPMIKRIKILSILFIGLISYILVSKVIRNAPKIATYSIQDKPNYIDKTYNWINNIEEQVGFHPIIRITNKTAGCTAFVVSDTTAITAGHCIVITQLMIDNKYSELIEKSEKIEQIYIEGIVKLENTCPEDFRCMQDMIEIELMLKEELAARDKLRNAVADTYKIIGVDGLNTGITAIAYSKHKTRDFGFLKGDFKKFKKLSIRSKWHVERNDILKVCGYFGGRIPPTCVKFLAVGSYGFTYSGRSMFVPGLSGGPAIDHLGYVVGIAVNASGEYSHIEPIIGVMDLTTDTQHEEIEKQLNK